MGGVETVPIRELGQLCWLYAVVHDGNLPSNLELSPEEAKARVNLGFALVQPGRVDEAIARYQKALRIDPKYPEYELS